jgi:hypothetical protein
MTLPTMCCEGATAFRPHLIMYALKRSMLVAASTLIRSLLHLQTSNRHLRCFGRKALQIKAQWQAEWV